MILTILAYALLIFGLPLVIGGFTSTIFIVALEFIIKEKWKKIPQSIFDFIDGLGSTVVAILMFYLFGIKTTFYIPVILSIVIIIWNSSRKEINRSYAEIIGIWGAWLYFFYFLL